MMTPNVVQIPVSEDPAPQVSKQKTWSEIEVANGGALPLGSWVLAGEQIGIVRSHNNGRAIVALTYQHTEGGWGRVRTAAQMGALVVGMGTIYGTQSLSHLPKDVVSQATIGVVFRSEGQDGTDVVKRWPELRAVANEIGRLEVGEAFVIARNTPWPVKFDEPAFLPEALRRKLYTAPTE